jgi:hypothetical protein
MNIPQRPAHPAAELVPAVHGFLPPEIGCPEGVDGLDKPGQGD